MASPTSTLPTRSATNSTDDAIPEDDASETTKLLHERLQAWKHACGYFEDYVEATSKVYASSGKDYDKVIKTVSNPLKEGHHFEQNLGGVAGLFENLRTNTQGIANSNTETSKTLKASVLPIFERLHNEIKNKTKELSKGAGKGSKAVDKARNTSQKHIELLGQHTAAYESTGSNIKAADDPYLIQRQVYHRLNKQVQEENNNRDDMLAVQNNFSTFEAHVLQTFQTGLQQFNMAVSNQSEQTRSMHGDVVGTAQRIPPDFEWNGFVKRNASILIDPSSGKRTVENIGFANQDHKATQPLIAGSLERQSGLLKKWDTSFYVVTPSKYLHEFKTDDDFAKDPTPENSLYLPDCLIGAVDGVKFNVRGKDSSGGAIGNSLARSKEFKFKAHTPTDAQKWHSVISSVAGQTTTEMPDSSAPSSPSVGRQETPIESTGTSSLPPSAAAQETGVTGTTGLPATTGTTAAPGSGALASHGVASADKA